MPKRMVTMAGSVVAAMAGGWLILAPFALGYRPGGGAWDRATEVDVWSGVGVVVVALVALAATVLATVADLRGRGVLPARTRRSARSEARRTGQDQTAGPAAGPPASRAAGPPASPPTGPADSPTEAPPSPGAAGGPDLRELLVALVQALLADTPAPAGQRSPNARPPGTHPDGAGEATEGAPHGRWRQTS